MTNILKIQHWHMSIAFYPQWWMNCVSIPRYYIYFFYVKAFLMTILLESISKSCHILEKRTWSTIVYGNGVYILSGPSMKHERPEAHPSLSHSGLYWGSIYFCGKNDVICYVIKRKVMAFFYKKRPNFMVPNWLFDHMQPFLV